MSSSRWHQDQAAGELAMRAWEAQRKDDEGQAAVARELRELLSAFIDAHVLRGHALTKELEDKIRTHRNQSGFAAQYDPAFQPTVFLVHRLIQTIREERESRDLWKNVVENSHLCVACEGRLGGDFKPATIGEGARKWCAAVCEECMK